MKYFETKPEKVHAVQITRETINDVNVKNIINATLREDGVIVTEQGEIVRDGSYLVINADTGLGKIMEEAEFNDRFVEVEPPQYTFSEMLPMLSSGRRFTNGQIEISYIRGEFDALIRKESDGNRLYTPEVCDLVSNSHIWVEVI